MIPVAADSLMINLSVLMLMLMIDLCDLASVKKNRSTTNYIIIVGGWLACRLYKV